MISFRSFVTAIHDAIVNASDALMDKNVSILDKYFIEGPQNPLDSGTSKHTLVPRSVILEYPHINAAGTVETVEVSVPLITLVPLTMSQIEKATLTADFEMDMVDGELHLDFANKNHQGLFSKRSTPKKAKLEITLTPQETSEGLKLLVEGYEAILKRQIS